MQLQMLFQRYFTRTTVSYTHLSMEFLMGRSLKTSLYNLEIVKDVEKMLKEYDIKLDNIYENEPDAGLGNGGLGRLAAVSYTHLFLRNRMLT